MMTQEELIAWFLETHDHPEQLTDEQLQQMLADDEMRRLVQQLGLAKRAFKQQDEQYDSPSVDDAWEKFAADHAEQLESLDDKAGRNVQAFVSRFPLRKIAASLIGALVVSGIAIAAINIAQGDSKELSAPAREEQVTHATPSSDAPAAATTLTDTTDVVLEPVTLDNIALDEMLAQMADYYQVQVVFDNEQARSLRFYFVWYKEQPLDQVVETLNRFEHVNIELDDNKLVVR